MSSWLVALLLVGCAGDLGGEADRVTSVVLTPSATELVVGESLALAVSVAVVGDPDRGVVWSSSDAGVATVVGGVVEAVGVGSAVVSAVSSQAPSVSGESLVTVLAPPGVLGAVVPGAALATCDGVACTVERVSTVDRVTLTAGAVEIAFSPGVGGGVEGDGVLRVPVGGPVSLSLAGLAATDRVRVWSVAGEQVGGLLGSLMPSADGAASLAVTPPEPAVQPLAAAGVSLLLSLVAGDGVVVVVQVGIAVGEPEAVPEPVVEDVTIEGDAATTVVVGGSVQLTAVVTVSGGAATTVAWTSSDPSVASVSDEGIVQGLSVGVATVTAVSTVDPNRSAAVTVSVTPAPAVLGVSIAGASTRSLFGGDSEQLAVTVTSVGGAAEAVTWSSSDVAVVTVSSEGLVVGVASGTATVTATSSFDPSKSAGVTFAVATVPESPSDVTVSPGDRKLTVAFTLSDGGSPITTVEYRLDAGAWTDSGTLTSPVTIAGLTNDTTYSVQIRAANVVGASEPSAPVAATPSTFYLASNGVTVMCPNASVDDSRVVEGVTYTKRARSGITPENAATTCTSGITDMSYLLFSKATFNGDIGSWDTSSVTDMSYMFFGASAFNQPIGAWDTSSVTNMYLMFSGASLFNQLINYNPATGAWDTGNVTEMGGMFFNASAFNQPIGAWDTSSVTSLVSMFQGASAFNQPLAAWNTSSVTSMESMFQGASAFNQPLAAWNTSSVTVMNSLFQNAVAFNEDIAGWNTSNVTGMSYMFAGASLFNQPIAYNSATDAWNTSKVTTISNMFLSALAFDQDIGNWHTSSVTNMGYAFSDARAFNQPIGGWDTRQANNMTAMFFEARAFNQDLRNWNVAQVPCNKPFYFDQGATAWELPRPSWSQCPPPP